MQAEIDSDGLEVFIKRMKKFDTIMGDTDRMEFFHNKIKEYEKVIIDNIDSSNNSKL